jgi:Zn-dependent protease
LAGIDIAFILVNFSILIVSLTLHEAAHAWSADRLGDDTARRLGRVSLNPAVHVDLIGTILFPLIAMITRLPVLGWAKPVPVNSLQLGRSWQSKFMLIAAAGPASNLVLALLFALVLRALPDAMRFGSLTGNVLTTAVWTNVVLAVFNMIPVPPLDGGNVLAGLLRGSAATAFDSLRPYGFLIIYGLLFAGVIDSIVVPVGENIMSILL